MSTAELKAENVRESSALRGVEDTEFINSYYALSQEPLNLRAVGQRWFETIYRRECRPHHSTGLILGGTPWLGALLKRRRKQAIMVDINPEMLKTAREEIESASSPTGGHVEYVCANWLEMPQFTRPIDFVVGDNCMNFLQYREGWSRLFDELMPRLSGTAQLILRFISIPPTHLPMTVDQIVRNYLSRNSINYTEVRAQMLLSHWEPDLKAIRTERAVDAFEANRFKFDPLFKKFPSPHNDLDTIRKFKNTGFVSFSPRFEEILNFVSGYFEISSIHFGPFGLSEYFPVIVARRR